MATSAPRQPSVATSAASGAWPKMALTSLIFAGWGVGAPLVGWISDRLGRRRGQHRARHQAAHAEAVEEHAQRHLQRSVGIEVEGREVAQHRAPDAEAGHQVLHHLRGGDALEEGIEEGGGREHPG
ncbi:MAG: hypothetical protein ACKOUS_04900, partial [Alphaproteobacteria bacterium]